MGERQLLVYLMDHAFETGEFHSLMGNLATVDEALWTRRLPESLRTIGEIALQHHVYHAGEVNRMRSVLAGEDRWQWQIDLGIDRKAGD